MVTNNYENYLRQLMSADVWHDRMTALAAKHGVTMIHDEILFESAEQFEAFNRELAGLEMP